MNVASTFLLKVFLIVTPVATTLVISPGYGYDPINLPKMLVLVAGTSFMITPLILQLKLFRKSNLLITTLTIPFLSMLLFSILNSDSSIPQQIWGTWGRSTGFLTYFGFLILFSAALVVGQTTDVEFIRMYFERLSYFISLYTLIQAADLDPISWSQKLMVATLGNINFMSSFLGIASISMLVRVLVEKRSFSSKIHYVMFTLLNVYLIWVSGSIQGIAILAAGSTITVAFLIRNRNGLTQAILLTFTAIPVGILAFVGTLGIGPMSGLRQETVIYRWDYWLVGLRITFNNWINGVGIDSYGDYYEEFRDLVAVERTGPQRVTNTAHNIFLDVSSGAGLIAGLLFLSIFIYTARCAWIVFKRGDFSPDYIAFTSMFVGFFIFCLISINQIGVGVWGFVFMGLVIGVTKRLVSPISDTGEGRLKSKNKVQVYPLHKTASLKPYQIGIAILFGALGAISAAIPNRIDAEMLRHVQSRDFQEMRKVAESSLSLKFYRDRYQTLLIEEGRDLEALKYAMREVRRDPRSNISWRIIAFSEDALVRDRIQAINALRKLDPANREFLSELSELEAGLR